MGAVACGIIHMIQRAALCDTAPVPVGTIATDAMVSTAYERLNVSEPPYEFHEPPIGLMRDYDRYGGRIVGRDSYSALVEGRAAPARIESCAIPCVETNVH